jgi:hypothetical protein
MTKQWSAAEAIRRAKGLVDAFGWPTYSPWKALHAIEKQMPAACPQVGLMWAVCTKEGVRRRRGETGLHPVIHIHVQDGQTKEGIDEWFDDCIERAMRHPLNGVTNVPPNV